MHVTGRIGASSSGCSDALIMSTAGVDIIGAMILTAFVRPVTWFRWPTLQQGANFPVGSTSGPVRLLVSNRDKASLTACIINSPIFKQVCIAACMPDYRRILMSVWECRLPYVHGIHRTPCSLL